MLFPWRLNAPGWSRTIPALAKKVGAIGLWQTGTPVNLAINVQAPCYQILHVNLYLSIAMHSVHFPHCKKHK